MKLEDKLIEEGIKPKHYDLGNQKVKCPRCQPPHNAKDRPLSFTMKPDGGAVWLCHHCEWKGGFTETNNWNRPKFNKKVYETPKVETKSFDNFLYKYFSDRGIGKTVVDDFKIFNENKWIAFQYFDKDGGLANIKYRTIDKKFRQSPNTKPILYNYDNVYKAEKIIFVEGEIDVLSLAEIGINYATTLSSGAPKEAKFDKNDQRFKVLEDCDLLATKVILFTDNDPSGKALHKELLHRFGKDICWYVKTPDGCKDANEVLVKHGPIKLKELIDGAIPYPIDGLYTANDYHSQIHDLYEGNFIRPIEIGMQGLDDIYKIMTSTFHCITGIPNHGKSIFLDQILLNLAKNHGWKFAMFSPEHSTAMHIRRLVQMYSMKGFDEGFGNRMNKEELNGSLDFIHQHFYFIETRESVPEIDLILDIAKSSIFKYGINGVIIDPYNEVSSTRKGNQREDEHIRDFISLCKRFARVYEIVLWVVAHPTKLPKSNDGTYLPPTAYDISGAAHWHNQSDAVLTIHRDFEDHSTRVITRKIREQDLYGKIGEAKFYYDFTDRCFKVDDKSDEDWKL